ncbi:hypothetical protein BN134_1998 [Cronobacter dublinensis 1210]|uniref:DUF4113 domain-containing protein n=1 Tax=Cronobacter dublinensis 1210 TaxID=1208656 RepID=A0ABP1W9K2_9ENTR|nr:hypothetical protein BN134_1998 [Cronobacter dublinensis 1210]CCJ87095.1 hypothetical protein BN133_3472 [Cronobacter dublinensis 582]
MVTPQRRQAGNGEDMDKIAMRLGFVMQVIKQKKRFTSRYNPTWRELM